MKDRKKNRTEELKQTPVSDGDTRPDQQPEGKIAQPLPVTKEIKNKVSEGRNADVNSLEDYKDAKAQDDSEVSDTGNTSPVPGGAKPPDE